MRLYKVTSLSCMLTDIWSWISDQLMDVLLIPVMCLIEEEKQQEQ